MQYKILNEQPWQILSNAMTISPSQTGYDLQVSANGKDYTTMFHVNAGVTRQVTNLSSGSYFRMLGNVGEVVVNWVRDCSGGNGGGGGGNAGELEPVTEFPTGVPAGTVVALASGNTVGVYQYDGTNWEPVAGGDMSNYYTKSETDAEITAATQGLATEAYVTAATQNFMTEADVTAITSPIQTQLDDVERVTATAYTELHQDIVDLSGATSGYATHAEVTAATANLMTSAQTQSAITAATQDFITSAYTGFTSESDFEAFQADVMDKEEVVASSLVELDGRFSSYVQGGGDITTMMRISQSDYDDLVSGGTVDSGTFYIITGSTGN